MSEYRQQFDEALALIAAHKKFLLVSHRRPDGDTLGATVALCLGLMKVGKNVTPACIDPISSRLQFISDLLPSHIKFVRDFSLMEYSAVIISDAGASHMTGFHEKYPEFLSKKIPILNIDHHASNDGFGTINIVDPKSSSATVLVYELLKKLGIPFDHSIALALMAGIYNDTGGMKHANTTQRTFEIAADLATHGVSAGDIANNLFKDSSISQLKLWGYILENMHRNEKNVVSSVVTESDFMTLGAHSGDTGGVVDLMNTVPDAQFTMLLAEDEGVVKGSLRTQRDDVNLNEIAGQFGGGGHAKASGFRVHGRLEREVRWKIVPSNSAV